MKSSRPNTKRGVPVRTLVQEQGAAWGLEVLGGRVGLSRRVCEPRVQKPGLALAGYVRQLHPDRVQVIGNPELAYLRTRSPGVARRSLERICSERVACFVVTNGAEVHDHVGRFLDERSSTWHAEGRSEGRPWTEEITVSQPGPRDMTLRAVTTRGGKTESVFEATLRRQ